MQATKLRLADVEIELFEAGQGRPLLFLHGGSGFAPEQPFVPLLSKNRRLKFRRIPGSGTRACRIGSTASTTLRTSISNCWIRPRSRTST